VAANPTVTAYNIHCAPGTDSTDCGYPLGLNLTVTSGSIYDVAYDGGPGFSLSQRCTIQSSAVCVEIASGTEANFPGTTTEVVDPTSVVLSPVTVTAGYEKIVAATASSTGSSKTSSASGSAASGSKSNSTTPNSGSPMQVGYAMSVLGLVSFIFAQF
jgi:hypothetical protein